MFRGLVCIPAKTSPVSRAGKCPAVCCQEIFSGNFSQEISTGSQEIFSYRIFNPYSYL